jgi:prefoldin subunit 5
MPVVDIEENIKEIRASLAKLSQEMAQLQGALRIFEDFKRGGLKTVDLPLDLNTDHITSDFVSIQEKPE